MNLSEDKLIESLVEIRLPNPDNFLKVKETLTRIGIPNKEKMLFQSCHILQKRGKYYIVHFKELFLLDGKIADFSDEDKGRRNTIVNLLADWGLVEVVDKTQIEEPQTPMQKIKVISFKDKGDWKLVEKYSIGKKKKETE
jgi:hypothetical protein